MIKAIFYFTLGIIIGTIIGILINTEKGKTIQHTLIKRAKQATNNKQVQNAIDKLKTALTHNNT